MELISKKDLYCHLVDMEEKYRDKFLKEECSVVRGSNIFGRLCGIGIARETVAKFPCIEAVPFKAYDVVCKLLNGDEVYGIDIEGLKKELANEYGTINANLIGSWVWNNLDRFSDDEDIRKHAQERLDL